MSGWQSVRSSILRFPGSVWRERSVGLWSVTFAALCVMVLVGTPAARAAKLSEQDLKARIEAATKDFRDMTAVLTAVYKNKQLMTQVDPAYSRLYEFRSANLSFKSPNKIRVDGKLGMVKFEYIISGCTKIVHAPSIRFSQREDYKDDPAKVQNALDLGIVTPSIWENRSVEVLDNPEAESNGEVNVRLRWPKGDMIYLAWIDAQNLWLKRFEKRDAQNKLLARVEYSEPKNLGGVIWVPTKVEMYTPDGGKAGASELTDIKVNTDLADSLFQ